MSESIASPSAGSTGRQPSSSLPSRLFERARSRIERITQLQASLRRNLPTIYSHHSKIVRYSSSYDSPESSRPFTRSVENLKHQIRFTGGTERLGCQCVRGSATLHVSSFRSRLPSFFDTAEVPCETITCVPSVPIRCRIDPFSDIGLI